MPELTARGELTKREDALREDLNKEYYALVDTVSGYDGRLMIVKGWSVTLSLAALGLGFQQQHYALFALGAATALAFWFLDAMMKGHQVRSYSRMRDIEVAAFALNAVELGDLGHVSAPRIDMSWGYRGQEPDWRTEAPQRRTPAEVQSVLKLRWVMPHVFLPHLVAVLLGAALFCAAAAGWSWVAPMKP